MTSTLIAYRTPPQMERKALAEAREAGHRAYLPRERVGARNVPTARGYVFAEGKPVDADHIRNAIGPVSRTELRRLYIRTSVTQRRHAFAPGDKVISASGYPGVVKRVLRGNRYDVEVIIANKPCLVKMKESDISLLHPHTK